MNYKAKFKYTVRFTMKNILMTVALALLSSMICRAQDQGNLANDAVDWQWHWSSGQLDFTLKNKANNTSLETHGPCFELVLGDGRTISAADFSLNGPPRTETLATDLASPVAARHFAGRQVTLEFTDAHDHLTAIWHASLRDGATYVREELTLQANGGDVWIKEITLFDAAVPHARTVGTVDGSPVVAGHFFLGYEHPMARNVVEPDGTVHCSFARNAVLKDGETLTQSCVIGTTPPGQLRRGFLAYLERERAHPYRPFLHYNSWFDIAWDTRKYNETESLDAINRIGQELAVQRGVKLDSYLFDDGWDDNRTLWQFHSGFPNGFTPLKDAAAKYDAGIGVWLSPFGGYSDAKAQRLAYASQFGFETNDSGFSLAGPKYFQRFHDICLEMVQKYGVNQFKFDGLAAGAKAGENGLTRDGDAMMRLIADLRTANPDIYINQTTGTWPSPFWLLYVDSTWRGGADHDFLGKGSWSQQWMTYRDAQTYANVVRRGPLYPLSSLMLHGIIYATNAAHLQSISDADFADQVREFFGNGTQLQEMYITPRLLDSQNWDDLAEGAKWSRANADVLLDTHWVGGDPARNQVYGWAAWSPRKAILVLRNPDDTAKNFTVDARRIFELPAGAPEKYVLHSPWAKDSAQPTITLQAGQPYTFNLPPFGLLVLEQVDTP
jgi:hypothetical protein